jgi:hypothetical protein
MDRRSFIRSMFLAGGAAITGAALLPRNAQAASLLDTLKDIEKAAPVAPQADLPAVEAQEVQFRRRRRRARRCVVRRGPRGRLRRVCAI